MIKPAVSYNPKQKCFYIHNASPEAPMNTEDNMIKFTAETKEQKALAKALQRALK